jgi:hypothetical protein
MLMDMACQKIPCHFLQALLTYLTNESPSLSFDERVERLRTFLAMLEKYKAEYRNAADAAARTAAVPAAEAAAAARSRLCSQDFNGVREWQDDAAAHQTVHSDLPERLVPSSSASRFCVRLHSTNVRLRHFAIAFVKQQIANGTPLSSITVSIIAEAYAASTGAAARTAVTLFKNQYLDIRAIIDAARNDDDSLCRKGSGRVSYNLIAAYLDAHRNTKTAAKVKAAADWCVEKLNRMESGKSFEEMKLLLLEMWSAEDSYRPQTSGSLFNYFKNQPFTMAKLLASICPRLGWVWEGRKRR